MGRGWDRCGAVGGGGGGAGVKLKACLGRAEKKIGGSENRRTVPSSRDCVKLL